MKSAPWMQLVCSCMRIQARWDIYFQWSGSSLIQVMTCYLFSIKPLPKPNSSVDYQLDLYKQTLVKFESKSQMRFYFSFQLFHFGNVVGTMLAILLRLNTLRPRQNGRHFAVAIFKCIFLNENVWIPIEISLKFVPQGPINNIPGSQHCFR